MVGMPFDAIRHEKPSYRRSVHGNGRGVYPVLVPHTVIRGERCMDFEHWRIETVIHFGSDSHDCSIVDRRI